MGEQNVSIKMHMEGKNVIVAYVLWWFLGWAGVHRLYLGRVISGITQLLLSVIGLLTVVIYIGWIFLVAWLIWWALDAYFISEIVAEENAKLGVGNSLISLTKSGGVNNDLEQLERLHALFEKGVITKEQYEERKALLI